MEWKFSRADIDKFRRIVRKEIGTLPSPEDAREAAAFLLDMFEICARHRNRERKWRERLAEEPEGFPLAPEETPCVICRNVKFGSPMWFDKLGPKCEPCQLMMRRHALPASACTDRSSWLDDDQTMEKLGIRPRKLATMIKEGRLVARTVKGTGFRLFLLSENPDLRGSGSFRVR